MDAENLLLKSRFTQTDIPNSLGRSCQTTERVHNEVQTDPCEDKNSIFAEFKQDDLVAFLKRVTPVMCSTLERNIKSKAFDRFKLSTDSDSISISLLHLLEKPSIGDLCGSSLSWNAVGTAVAIAYSTVNHENWCEHKSSVDMWSLGRKDFDPKKPNLTLETDCCVSCLSFHPKIPAILVAGKLNGELLLWDLSNEDDMLLSSSVSASVNHSEPVTGIHWMVSKGTEIEFVTCSLDGKILLWNFENDSLKPHKGYIILAKQLPRNFHIKMRKDNAEVGITSLTINKEDASIFIVGVEGGGIFQCSFESRQPAEYKNGPLKWRNPINMGFERHKGQVTSVHFSPFSRNLFLSSGSDGEIRIYTLLQPKPLRILHMSHSVNCAQWSLTRPMVFTCVGSSGQLDIWDLAQDDKMAVESCPLTLAKADGLAMQTNTADSGLLCTSSTDGTVQVWQLSGAVDMTDNAELQQLNTLSKNID